MPPKPTVIKSSTTIAYSNGTTVTTSVNKPKPNVRK